MLATTSSTEIAEWFAFFKLRNEAYEAQMADARGDKPEVAAPKMPSAKEIRREHFS